MSDARNRCITKSYEVWQTPLHVFYMTATTILCLHTSQPYHNCMVLAWHQPRISAGVPIGCIFPPQWREVIIKLPMSYINVSTFVGTPHPAFILISLPPAKPPLWTIPNPPGQCRFCHHLPSPTHRGVGMAVVGR